MPAASADVASGFDLLAIHEASFVAVAATNAVERLAMPINPLAGAHVAQRRSVRLTIR